MEPGVDLDQTRPAPAVEDRRSRSLRDVDGIEAHPHSGPLRSARPPGLPDTVRERIARETVAITREPAFQAKFRATGFEPLGLDAEATGRMYRDEVTRWSAFIKARGLSENAR